MGRFSSGSESDKSCSAKRAPMGKFTPPWGFLTKRQRMLEKNIYFTCQSCGGSGLQFYWQQLLSSLEENRQHRHTWQHRCHLERAVVKHFWQGSEMRKRSEPYNFTGNFSLHYPPTRSLPELGANMSNWEPQPTLYKCIFALSAVTGQISTDLLGQLNGESFFLYISRG